MTIIESYLHNVRNTFDEYRFVSGDCHNLAIALHTRFSGSLCAIIRQEKDEDDILQSVTYSHMLFIDDTGLEWDIDGKEADERWIGQWPDEPDKYGFVSEFEYVTLTLDELPAFLDKHDCKIDQELVKALLNF